MAAQDDRDPVIIEGQYRIYDADKPEPPADTPPPQRAPQTDKPDFLKDIEEKARKRAKRLADASGLEGDDYEQELQAQYDRLKTILLDKYYQDNPNVERIRETPQTPPQEPITPPAGDPMGPPEIPPSSFDKKPDMSGIPAIKLREQAIETNQTQIARENTAEYRKTIEEAGLFTLSAEQIGEIQKDHPDLDLSGEIPATAAHMTLLGVKAKRLQTKVESSNVLTRAEKNHLFKISRVMEVIYEENPEFEIELQQAALYPQITITRIPVPETPQDFPRDVKIAFNPVGNQFRTMLQSGKELGFNKAKEKASKAITKLTKKAAKEGVKKAASAAGAEAGAAAGSVVPVVGNIVGAAVGWLAGQVAGVMLDTLKKRTQDLRDLAGGIIVAGGQLAAWVVGIMWTATVGIGQAFIIGILSIPIIVGFIFLIINNSAWVTPPWQGTGSSGLTDDDVIDSAFIEVDKSVSPESVGNDALPVTANYTITVAAELSALTNIQFEDNCSSIKAGTPPTNPGCPPATNITINGVSTNTFPPTPPTTINPGSPVTITYQRVFAASLFSDTRTTDTFTVTADAEGVVGEVSAATAVLLIGNPPGPGNCADFGADITNSFASRIPGGNVRLLPVSQRAEDECIVPTVLAIHWSAGINDNPAGNDRTWETLSGNGYDCQFGTDTDDAQIWQSLYQSGVELPQCAGGQSPSGEWWNDISVHIEMAGVWFTDSPPPPNLNQLEITYQTACAIKAQYGIPWHQVMGHYQMTPGKSDPGKEFFENVFLPEIRQRCP